MPSDAGRALLEAERRDRGKFVEKGCSDLDRLSALYNTVGEWHRRADAIRAGMLRGLRLTNPLERNDMRPRRRPLLEAATHRVEGFAIEIVPGLAAVGNIYCPTSPTALMPVALLPHGHGEGGRFHANQQRLAASLASAGVLALTYDMQGYGEADQIEHAWPLMAALQTWQSIRVLDFALSFERVDRSRVLVSGHSGGATQSIYLTALDDRVTISAPVVMVSSAFYGGCVCESGMTVHQGDSDGGGLPTNNAEIAAVASSDSAHRSRPMLLVSIDGDWTALTPYREYPFIRRIYGLMGASDLVENRHLNESEHDYGFGKRLALYDFLVRRWGLDFAAITNASGAMDDVVMPVLARDELSYFPASSARKSMGAGPLEAIESQFQSAS